jgi:hypothetical protein
VLGHVDRGAAVLAAEREPLEDPDHQQRRRREHADRGVGRQHPDQRGRGAHDDQRHQERIFAADEVADAAEEQRTERPHDEADRERRQVGNQRERLVAARIEKRGDHARQAAEDVEVVPLDHRPDRRRGDDLPDLAVARNGDGGSRRDGRSVHAVTWSRIWRR